MQKIKNNTPEIKTKEKSDVVTISLSRTLLRHAAAVAVLIFGLFMISHPLDKTNNIENYASFISASLLKNPVIPVLNENVLFNDSLIQPDHIVVSEPEEIISTTNQTFSSLVLSEKEKVAEVTAPQKTFYIIIGSFPTEELANRRVNFYKRQGIENVGIVQKDDKYRLYINSFDDREVADSYLDDIRKDVSFKDAWMYIKRV